MFQANIGLQLLYGKTFAPYLQLILDARSHQINWIEMANAIPTSAFIRAILKVLVDSDHKS